MERPRLIEIERYGSEGWIPTKRDRKRCKHGGENSCISGSGGSLCGGYEGQVEAMGRDWVVCTEDTPKAWAKFCTANAHADGSAVADTVRRVVGKGDR